MFLMILLIGSRPSLAQFTDIGAGLPGVDYSSVAWGDYDSDGDLDILLAGSTSSGSISRVYKHDGGTFTDIGTGLEGVTYCSVAWGDYDNDGDLDILLTGYAGSGYISRVYNNDGGGFTDIGAGLEGVAYCSVAWGDYDNDGDLDILLTGYVGFPTLGISSVYNNDGGVFTDIGAGLEGVRSGSVAWGDYDNDGDLDILLTGNPGPGHISRVYNNDGGVFSDIGAGLVGVDSSSVAWGDYDNDGDLDILLTGNLSSRIYRNDGGTPNTVPTPPSGLGHSRTITPAATEATFQWNAATDPETPTAGLTYNLRVGTTPGGSEVVSAMANSNTGYRRVVQLGNANHNLSWTVTLPVDEETCYWSVQAVDGAFEGSAFAVEESFDIFREFVDIGAGLEGVEDASVAWGDYDSDGDLDIFLAGSSRWDGEISRVYNNDGGIFTDIGAGLKGVEDPSVAWGDYDNDGDLDILLTGSSGSGYISRVYNNDGGVFTDIGAGLERVRDGSVAWGDYDNDGDLDILLTGQNNKGPYRTSRVYNNDGGTFTDIGAGLEAVNRSSVAWGDYDNDGDLDILLTGESDSGLITFVYNNDGGIFTEIGAGLEGVVDGSVAWGDYDNDGDLDILLTGNAGVPIHEISRIYSNDGGIFTDIEAGLEGVCTSSVAWGDYDNDGDLDILLTGYTAYPSQYRISRVYYNDGGNFTEMPLDLLEPVRYSSVAWGDYDNDGDLDILLAGERSTYPYGISLVYQNRQTVANTPPSAPLSLVANRQPEDPNVTFSWTASSDTETPAAGLSYNMRIGTTPGGSEIMSPMADASNGYRRVVQLGNVSENMSWPVTLPGNGTYYWGVQAVDGAFAGSGFATEETMTITDVPTCVISPGTLDFGTILVGNSSELDFTITNTGGGTLSGAVSGGCPHYSIVSGGGSYDLTNGQLVTVKVRFEPTAGGTYLCTIETGSTFCGDVSCIGETPATCEVYPTSLDFDTVFVASSKDTTFTIRNTGGGVLSGSVTESCSHYSIVSTVPPDDPYNLAHGDSLVVTVRFEPAAGGMHPCTIQTGDALCNDVLCTGVGLATACEVTPTSLDFSTVRVGSWKDTTFTIRNTGGGTLSGYLDEFCSHYSIVSTVPPLDPFLPYCLYHNDSLVVTVRFAPDTEGPHECTIETGDALCIDVSCTGVGQGPVCEVYPTSLDFDTVFVASSKDTTFTIRNTGGGVLTGSVSESCSYFNIVSTVPPNDPYNLEHDDSLVVTVRFEPHAVDLLSCTIETGGALCSDVSCTGVGAGPTCLVTPTSIDFGMIPYASTLDYDTTFTIKNIGGGLLIGNVSESCDYFSIESGGGPFQLLYGDSVLVAIRFDPQETGTHQCTVEAGVYLCSDVSVTATAYMCPVGSVLHVDADATGVGDGSSWADACTELRDALVIAPLCPAVTEIWVAEGTYTPTAGTDRAATFRLQDNLAIYGGFDGTETMLSERDWVTNVTILSGDLEALDTYTDNSYHVVTGSGTDSTAVLDGFTVTGGNADGPGAYDDGGGIYNNEGEPALANLIVSGNGASDHGGGMYNYGSDLTLLNVVFSNNSAGTGGGMSNFGGSSYASPTLVNVLFSENTASAGGGGMYNEGSDAELLNVTLSGNTSPPDAGGGMSNASSNPVLTNAVFWGNSEPEILNVSSTPGISYSLIAGSGGSASWDPGFGTDLGGNIDVDPLFINAVAGNYRLGVGSPAIDAGDSLAPGLPATDLDGNARIIGDNVDMGAYEDPWVGVPPMFTVSPSSIDFGGIAVGATRDTTFVMKNIGGGIVDVNVSGTYSYFSIEWGGGPFSLAPGESRVVGIQYAPTEAGVHECSIETNPSVWSQLALVADQTSGLQIIDVGDPTTPTFVGSYDTPGLAYDVYFRGDHAFIADENEGLQVIDISNPTAPILAGTCDTPDWAMDIYLSKDHAFIADRASGLQVIDVSDPTTLTLITAYDTPDDAWGVYISGDYAFVADGASGLQVIDISDPTNPDYTGSYDTPGFALGVIVKGNYAFVADQTSGLQVIDVSDPTSPEYEGSYDTPSSAYGLYVLGDYAYVADFASGLQIINISNPANPTFVGNCNPAGSAVDVSVSGDYAFMASSYQRFQVINISNPEDPTLVTTYTTPDVATGVAVIPWGNVVCTGYAGYTYAVIDTVVDVPDDQGRQVRIHFMRSFYDDVDETTYPIERYDIHQRIDDPVLMTSLLADGEPITDDLTVTLSCGDRVRLSVPLTDETRYLKYEDRYFLEVSSGMLAAPPGLWEVVGTISAQQQNQYITRVSTVADSTVPIPIPWSVYYISAHSTTPAVYFDSQPDSGYSVDNLPPGVPLGFAVAYNTGSGNQLTWDPSPEPDFQYYRVYRGDAEDFMPAPGNLVHETATPGWTDTEYDGWDMHYKITALDYVGNESDASSPTSTTGTDTPHVPKAFALYQNAPNPFNPTTMIRFDLPRAVHVKLSIYNVKGELVSTIVDQHMTEGRKEVTWSAKDNRERAVSSGIYFYRLVTGDFVQTKKMVLLR